MARKRYNMAGLITVKMKNLLINPKWNLSEHNKNVEKNLYNAIKLNGQLQTLLVREIDDGNYELLDGYVRYSIFQSLKYQTVECYSLGKINDATAAMITLQMKLNTHEYDVLKVANIIKLLIDSGISPRALSNVISFSEDDITRYADIYNWEWSLFERHEVPKELHNLARVPKNSLF